MTKAYGKNLFELLAEQPDQADTFHRAMTDSSAVSSQAILEAYDFSGIQRLADIGGGHGLFLASILKQYPRMQGLLYDLPEVLATIPPSQFVGCEGRIHLESGSFFARAPEGCDAYVLKHILHNWSDDDCIKILRLLREQLPAYGRGLICEMVIQRDSVATPAKMLDIEMLLLTVGGKERSSEEFRDVFASAGLRIGRIVLSFPKIISGRIGGAVQPGSEWRQWRQIVGLLDARAHLSVMPSAGALDCNTPHKRKEFAAGASR